MALKPYNPNKLLEDAYAKGTIVNPATYPVKSSKPSTSTPTTKELPTLQSFTSAGGSGGGYNLSGIISAYTQSADADKALAQQVYDTTVRNLNTALDRAKDTYNKGVSNTNTQYESTRGDLLTSLKRFQENNAKSVENQKRAYISDQAALESARLEADRQTRIDAAARGLGGSGLQQLAQLQNLLNQGQDISQLALSNQSEMDDLRTELADYTEDINTDLEKAQKLRDTTLDNLLTTLNYAQQDNTTGLQDALTTYQNAINNINAKLAENTASARATASSRAAADTNLIARLNDLQDNAITDIKTIANASDKEFKKLAKQQYGDNYNKSITKKKLLEDYVADYVSAAVDQGAVNAQRGTLKSNLNSYLKYYGY